MARAATNHRAAAAFLLVVAMALGAAQAAAAPAAAEAEAGSSSAGTGRHGEPSARRVVPLGIRVRVHCTGLHVVRPGETCASVARAARLTVAQFLQLNQNVTCATLSHGQWVCVRGTAIGG